MAGNFGSAFAFFVLLWTLSSLVDFAFIAGRRAEFVLSKGIIFSLLKIPLPILLVLFFHTFGVAAAWGLATGVAVAVALFLFLPRVQRHYRPVPKLNLGIIKNMWEYSAGSYLASLFGAAPSLILPLIVVNLAGAKYNAYFYVAWAIAGLLFAIPSAVAQSLFAEGAHFEHRLGTDVRRSLIFVFALLIPALIFVFLLGNWLLSLFGEGYAANGLRLLQILSLSSLLIGINDIYRSILRVQDRIKELVAISGFVVVVVPVGGYLVTPVSGIIGIGYVWLAAQGLVTLYALFALRSFWRVPHAV
jgi:O-antigen/teichoic acid export membrane protein